MENKKIEEISSNYKLQSTGGGLFHDTRNDVKLLAQVINIQYEKINELIQEINRLKQKI